MISNCIVKTPDQETIRQYEELLIENDQIRPLFKQAREAIHELGFRSGDTRVGQGGSAATEDKVDRSGLLKVVGGGNSSLLDLTVSLSINDRSRFSCLEGAIGYGPDKNRSMETSKKIRIRRGLNLPVSGEPDQVIEAGPEIKQVAVVGPDFVGMKPKMAVEVGDRVKKGQLLFTDKKQPGVRFTAPGGRRCRGDQSGRETCAAFGRDSA